MPILRKNKYVQKDIAESRRIRQFEIRFFFRVPYEKRIVSAILFCYKSAVFFKIAFAEFHQRIAAEVNIVAVPRCLIVGKKSVAFRKIR